MVQHLVDRATSDRLIGPDWAMNLVICNKLNHNPEKTSEAVSGIKKRLSVSTSKVQILALTLLETIINNCGELIHIQVAEKEILHKMVDMVKRKPKIQVKEKILILIDTWQEIFSGPQGRYPQYRKAYQDLLRVGIIFPQRSQTTFSSGQIGSSTTYPQNSLTARQETIDTATESEFPTLSLTEIQNARGIMDVLTEMMNAIDGNNKEGLKQEVIVDLLSQCQTYKQRVVQLVNSTLDDSLLCEGLALNDDLHRLFAKHEAIASGKILTVKEEKSKKEVLVKDVRKIIDVGSSETKDVSVMTSSTNGPKIDLLSGDDLKTHKTENSSTLLPLGPPQPKPSTPAVTPDDSIVLIDLLSDTNSEISIPTSNPHSRHQMVQQNYSNGLGHAHQDQSFYGQVSSGPVLNLQISQQHQKPFSPVYRNQPFWPSFSPPASPHYGGGEGENNNGLALTPPPWEIQPPSYSPQYYPPPPPVQVTQMVITTDTPHSVNNLLEMFLPQMIGGHVSHYGHNPKVTNNHQNHIIYGGQLQPPEEYLIEQQMSGMSLQDHGNNIPYNYK